MWSTLTLQLVEAACEEDLGADGDITSALTAGADPRVLGRVVVRHAGVICGLALGPVICRTFSERLNQPLELRPQLNALNGEFADGAHVEAGTCTATVRGPRSAVLALERTLLNFLSRMSGVATLTRRFVTAAGAANPDVKILDTRKTLPGWRQLDKYAVRIGGGNNHRFGLYDAILIKDNHLADIPTDRLRETLTRWLRRVPRAEAGEREGGTAGGGVVVLPNFVEVEVDNLEELAEVCKVERVDVVLLDNFSPDEMRAAVARRDQLGLKGRLELEASGGVRLDNVADIAATGVDRISVGALTHSAVALDIALEL
jgi:nicotinate-nucleotide pyrophosphorylase (carboxylating)